MELRESSKTRIIRNSVKSERKKKIFIVGKTLNEFFFFLYPIFRYIRFQAIFSLEREFSKSDIYKVVVNGSSSFVK